MRTFTINFSQMKVTIPYIMDPMGFSIGRMTIDYDGNMSFQARPRQYGEHDDFLPTLGGFPLLLCKIKHPINPKVPRSRSIWSFPPTYLRYLFRGRCCRTATQTESCQGVQCCLEASDGSSFTGNCVKTYYTLDMGPFGFFVTAFCCYNFRE